ncbi:uncharacterized protein LOC116604620 isoform X2 [Nematostella vectensis]|uniref:uncharacterized protein LOC116604620 isoform X2 n=1 Tax=Nematostella vectensis TaxID=45351 RepID=UPI0013900A24|nr:uncharacterized protein LOC116604620 isoform X2 [Nematostella vectensis]
MEEKKCSESGFLAAHAYFDLRMCLLSFVQIDPNSFLSIFAGVFLLTDDSVSKAHGLIEYSGPQQLESLFHGRPATNPKEASSALATYTASPAASFKQHFWLVATAVYVFIACILVKLLADAFFIYGSELEEIAHNEAVHCAVHVEPAAEGSDAMRIEERDYKSQEALPHE